MPPEMLDDVWESRDRPVLVQLARVLEEKQRTLQTSDQDALPAIVG